MQTVLLLMLAIAAVRMVQFGLDTQNLSKKPANVLTNESYVLAVVVIAGLVTAVLLYLNPQAQVDSGLLGKPGPVQHSLGQGQVALCGADFALPVVGFVAMR